MVFIVLFPELKFTKAKKALDCEQCPATVSQVLQSLVIPTLLPPYVAVSMSI
jgi:hypothetical protein